MTISVEFVTRYLERRTEAIASVHCRITAPLIFGSFFSTIRSSIAFRISPNCSVSWSFCDSPAGIPYRSIRILYRRKTLLTRDSGTEVYQPRVAAVCKQVTAFLLP